MLPAAKLSGAGRMKPEEQRPQTGPAVRRSAAAAAAGGGTALRRRAGAPPPPSRGGEAAAAGAASGGARGGAHRGLPRRLAQVSGCTYPTATNFNKGATVDDGSCVFPTFPPPPGPPPPAPPPLESALLGTLTTPAPGEAGGGAQSVGALPRTEFVAVVTVVVALLAALLLWCLLIKQQMRRKVAPAGQGDGRGTASAGGRAKGFAEADDDDVGSTLGPLKAVLLYSSRVKLAEVLRKAAKVEVEVVGYPYESGLDEVESATLSKLKRLRTDTLIVASRGKSGQISLLEGSKTTADVLERDGDVRRFWTGLRDAVLPTGTIYILCPALLATPAHGPLLAELEAVTERKVVAVDVLAHEAEGTRAALAGFCKTMVENWWLVLNAHAPQGGTASDSRRPGAGLARGLPPLPGGAPPPLPKGGVPPLRKKVVARLSEDSAALADSNRTD